MGESQWRGQQLEAARRLGERYGGASEMPPSLVSLDAIVDGWLDDEADDRADINDLANAVGIALGHHLAKATGLSWVLATDEHGSEIALHREEGSVLVHPTNLVAKRLVDGQRAFVQRLSAELTDRIRSLPS